MKKKKNLLKADFILKEQTGRRGNDSGEINLSRLLLVIDDLVLFLSDSESSECVEDVRRRCALIG